MNARGNRFDNLLFIRDEATPPLLLCFLFQLEVDTEVHANVQRLSDEKDFMPRNLTGARSTSVF